MKVIDLKEAQTNLEQYARECQSSPVVVTVDGKLAFEMLPVRTDDAEFVERLIEENDSFRKLVEERHAESDHGQVTSLEEVRRRLA
ncbi:MAG TPA: hypothetical protein VND64_29620 [Pirellulales bacterium]|nr:hypothetical protein [Pirellulales bacterium]